MESLAESYGMCIATVAGAGEEDFVVTVAVLVFCDLNRCDGL